MINFMSHLKICYYRGPLLLGKSDGENALIGIKFERKKKINT